ncbi:hypothetical protein E2C01_077570 [Portunus trituberculatus]|uniref:Uncharacterized protein n=1 Tax=Portunus trituberculatus TaxID=210409 RepID=A0A5B7IRN2_PORTR|nr:hypothetical protein [Portunus trituberculatus]
MGSLPELGVRAAGLAGHGYLLQVFRGPGRRDPWRQDVLMVPCVPRADLRQESVMTPLTQTLINVSPVKHVVVFPFSTSETPKPKQHSPSSPDALVLYSLTLPGPTPSLPPSFPPSCTPSHLPSL